MTVADFGSQALICRVLREQFDEPVVAEEDTSVLAQQQALVPHILEAMRCALPEAHITEDNLWTWLTKDPASSRDTFWTLDPIDGTKGFLRGGHYAIALACVVNEDVHCAVLGCPNLSAEGEDTEAGLGTIFAAVAGYGSWAFEIETGRVHPVRVSNTTELRPARLCESYESAHTAHSVADALAKHLGISGHPRRLDSQAKYALIAAGNAEMYVRIPTRSDYRERIWDHASGYLIVQEAGGCVTDLNGRALNFTCGETLETNYGVLATNGHLHGQIVAACQELLSSR